MVWYENDGAAAPSFSAHTIATVIVGRSIRAADMDGDGDLDVVTASANDSTIAWYESNGDPDPGFTAHMVGTTTGPTALSVADLDGDGDLDVLHGANNAPQLGWHENDGSATPSFTAHVIATPVGGDRGAVHVADLNGDGDLDVVAGSTEYGAAKLFWYGNERADYGDLPSGYGVTTLTDNGARHILGSLYLGSDIDHEFDGHESADAGRDGASGDDGSGTDDEDGISVVGSWHDGADGGSVQVAVTGGAGYLSGWMDWNDDGDFADAGEQILDMQPVSAGTQTLSFDIPAGAIPTNGTYDRFSRFRLAPDDSTSVQLTSLVTNGEVEDHYLQFTGFANDFGDAPSPYPTTLAEDGARHVATGPTLGANRDSEADGAHSTAANADDTTGTPDDEDGLNNPLVDLMLTEGTDPSVNVIVTNNTASTATLYGWIDYNADGVFDNATERASIAVVDGTTNAVVTLTFPTVPENSAGSTYARFRFSTDTANAQNPTGPANDGEVEDYPAWITQPTSGLVKSHLKISDTVGNFTGTLDNEDRFGNGVRNVGDLDGDGVTDLAVGAWGDDDGGGDCQGALWMLFMNSDGTVKSHQKISDTEGGFTGELDAYDYFGEAFTVMGDLDGDGVTDLALGAPGDDDGGSARGAVWILYLNSDGTVKDHRKISETQGGFAGMLDDFGGFGARLASLGDLNGDGVTDLAVGAYADDDGGTDRGAVWVLFLNSDGTVQSHQKISDTQGGFTGALGDSGFFGHSITNLGDLDGDGVIDMAVSTHYDDDGSPDAGAVWVLFLNSNGTVKDYQKISSTQGGFSGSLDSGDRFGVPVMNLGDLDGDGVTDLGVGALWDDDGGTDRGALWVVYLNSDGTVKTHRKISDTRGNFTGTLDDGDYFGNSIANVGDFDGDGVVDLAVGAIRDDDGGTDRGAVWIVNLLGPVDTGDAPASYITSLADDGPSHLGTGPILGTTRDIEVHAVPSANADGDDTAGTPDDEDGITVVGSWQDGTDGGSVQVVVTGGSGYLSGWIDWNDDDDFEDMGEQIFNMLSLAAGTHTVSFDIPAGAIPTNDTYNRFARFRLAESDATTMTLAGHIPSGEVEDHLLQFTGIANMPPTDLDLSPTSVDENEPVGTVVGTFTTTDPLLPGDSHTDTLAAGDATRTTPRSPSTGTN